MMPAGRVTASDPCPTKERVGGLAGYVCRCPKPCQAATERARLDREEYAAFVLAMAAGQGTKQPRKEE